MTDNIYMDLILQESRALYESMKKINVTFSNISGTTLDSIGIVNASSFVDELGIMLERTKKQYAEIEGHLERIKRDKHAKDTFDRWLEEDRLSGKDGTRWIHEP